MQEEQITSWSIIAPPAAGLFPPGRHAYLGELLTSGRIPVGGQWGVKTQRWSDALLCCNSRVMGAREAFMVRQTGDNKRRYDGGLTLEKQKVKQNCVCLAG